MEEAGESVLPHEARAALTALFDHLDALTVQLDTVERKVLAWHKTSKESQRLATAPGVGPLTATALVAAIGDGAQFQSARHFAAWLGLTPRISASGGREHIGRISKGGDRYLRTLLIHGARAMVHVPSEGQAAALAPGADGPAPDKRRRGRRRAQDGARALGDAPAR